jgi:hypothetical protein
MLNTKFKKFLRELYNINNIKEVYTELNVNNADDAYKILNDKFNKLQEEETKSKAEKKAKEWINKQKEKTIKKQEDKDNKIYIQEIALVYDVKNKKSTIWRKVNKFFTITGKKSELKKLANKKFEEEIKRLEEKSPLTVKNFVKKFGDITLINKTKGITNIKMKHANVFELSNENKQIWNTNTGKCVFDYLIYLYGETKGFKKIMNYEYLNNEFGDDALNNGVSIEQIDLFCKKYNLSYYALDCYEKIIKFYLPTDKKNNVSSLIFRIINEHMYPIDDYKKRQSIVSKNRKDINIKSIEIEKIDSEKQKPLYELIAPTEECDKNEFAINYIQQLNKIPYPIKSDNIFVEDGNIERLIIDNKIILTEPINPNIKSFYENTGKVYQGECLQNILYELWEQTYEEKIYEGELMSSFSPDVNSLLSQENIKNRVHFGSTREITEDLKELFLKQSDGGLSKGAVSCDIEKCYSSLLLNPLDEFMKLDSYNFIEEFLDDDYYYNDSELPFGLYVVQTNDLTILHQSNIYSNKILDYAKKYNIEFKIIYKIAANDKIEKTYFHKILKTIKDKTSDIDLIKLVMNTITGCLGKTYGKHLKVGLTTSLDEACENELMKINENFYFKKFNTKNNNIIIFGKVEKTKFINHSLPIYIQILDWSNIKLHQMITQMGGECIYRKTDCAVCIGGNKVHELNKDINDITKTWGSFRNEDCSDDNVTDRNYKRLMNMNRHINIPILNDNWNILNQFKSSNQWKEILDYAINNGGLFVDGRAGTGKTFIIHKGIETGLLPQDNKYRLAFTNKASRNINGTTIHKALSINKKNKSNIKSMTLKYQGKTIIVIDEIGMINLKLWKKIICLKESNKELIFILLGDKRQCKPIEDLDLDYFNSNILKHIVNFNKCELTERQRYDEQLWNYLEDYFEKDIVGKLKHKKNIDKNDILNSRMICYFNSTRRTINKKCMELLKSDNSLYLPYERIDDDDKFDSAYIYEGLPVMCIKNNKKLDIINSDEFNVKSYNDKTINLINVDTNEELEIEINEFHKNFVVNYISTTHKLQGSTITKNLFIFDWYEKFDGSYCLKNEKNIGYTALSRVKSLEQIYIIN